jgi:hypothetical protein
MTADPNRRVIRRVILLAVLIGYLCAAGVLVLWPDGERVRRILLDVYFFAVDDLGLPRWGGPDGYAVLGNVLLLTPLAVAITVYAGWRRWWVAVGSCALISMIVEWAQTQTGMQRVPEWPDVYANVGGALVAATSVAVLLRSRETSRGRAPARTAR